MQSRLFIAAEDHLLGGVVRLQLLLVGDGVPSESHEFVFGVSSVFRQQTGVLMHEALGLVCHVVGANPDVVADFGLGLLLVRDFALHVDFDDAAVVLGDFLVVWEGVVVLVGEGLPRKVVQTIQLTFVSARSAFSIGFLLAPGSLGHLFKCGECALPLLNFSVASLVHVGVGISD